MVGIMYRIPVIHRAGRPRKTPTDVMPHATVLNGSSCSKLGRKSWSLIKINGSSATKKTVVKLPQRVTFGELTNPNFN